MQGTRTKWWAMVALAVVLLLPALALAQVGKPVQAPEMHPAQPAIFYLFCVAIGHFLGQAPRQVRGVLWGLVLLPLPLAVWYFNAEGHTPGVFAASLFIIGCINGNIVQAGPDRKKVAWGLVLLNACLLGVTMSLFPNLHNTHTDYALLAMVLFAGWSVVLLRDVMGSAVSESWRRFGSSETQRTRELGLYPAAAAWIVFAVSAIPFIGYAFFSHEKIFGPWLVFVMGAALAFAQETLTESPFKLSAKLSKVAVWCCVPLLILGALWMKDGWASSAQVAGLFFVGAACGRLLRAAHRRGTATLCLLTVAVLLEVYLITKTTSIPNARVYISTNLSDVNMKLLNRRWGTVIADFLNQAYIYGYWFRAYLMQLAPFAALTAGVNLAYLVALRGLGVDDEDDGASALETSPSA